MEGLGQAGVHLYRAPSIQSQDHLSPDSHLPISPPVSAAEHHHLYQVQYFYSIQHFDSIKMTVLAPSVFHFFLTDLKQVSIFEYWKFELLSSCCLRLQKGEGAQ